MGDLEAKLREAADARVRLIATDGVLRRFVGCHGASARDMLLPVSRIAMDA